MLRLLVHNAQGLNSLVERTDLISPSVYCSCLMRKARLAVLRLKVAGAIKCWL